MGGDGRETSAERARDAQRTTIAELRLNETPGAQEAAGALVNELATATGAEPGRRTGIRAVVEELVREACERPRVDRSDGVGVRVATRLGRLEVEVTDRGLPLTPDESRRARSRRLAALGLVDELHIGAHGQTGNVAVCSVRLAPGSAELAEDQVGEDAPRISDAEAEALQIRTMREADAHELVRCVYRCYGYSYKDPMLYEPREIARELRNGTMSSVVAVTPEGAVVGHSAIFVEDPGDAVPESGKLVVDPRYRGHGIATRMAALRQDQAREEGIPGFWAEAVTNHVSSQREILHLGGSETGLLIGTAPPLTMVGFESAGDARLTLLTMFTPLRPVAATIHAPPRHAELLAALAERLGIDRTIESAAEAEPSGPTTLRTSAMPETGLAHVRVSEVGGDLASRVADAIESLDAFELGAIHLDLPLADPTTPGAAEELERLGFAFAAWMPRFAGGSDILRLQRVGGHPVETGDISCARPEGERVRDYVIADWHRVRRAGIE